MDERAYMETAMREAKLAAEQGETPVGAVLVKDGAILAVAHNRREQDGNALAHAEMLCIEQACRRLGGWRLEGCVLYVTLEPCPMCAGALIGARVSRVVYALQDPKAGCMGSLICMQNLPLPHRIRVEKSEDAAMARRSHALLADFFQSRRGEKPSTEERT